MNSSRTFARRPVAILGALALVTAASAATYTIPWHSIDGGGGASSGGPFAVTGVIGQSDAGTSVIGGAFCLMGGFHAAETDPCPASCFADLNADGTVNGADLGLLLGAWAGGGSADLDGSGFVDGADLGLLLGAWGPC